MVVPTQEVPPEAAAAQLLNQIATGYMVSAALQVLGEGGGTAGAGQRDGRRQLRYQQN